ncbi:precorrin-6y C5,15-methyltransferase (decarboxylating) subunit CbiE, partial [Desulfovibrio sp.]
MKQQNLLPGISLPAPRPSRPAETPPAPSPAASAVPDTDTWSPQESLLHSAFVFEPAGTAAEPVLILGLDCAQPLREGLAPARLRLIEQADVLCGGRRLLAAFDDLPARQLPLTAPLEPVLARISHLRAGGKKVVVLADGDPLFYGIGTTLLRQLGPEAVRILPGVSSLQQACARLGLPWHDVICLSLHGRDDLTPLHTAVHRQRPISLLTDARMTPDLLARHLLDRGVDWFAMHVFEHMGSDGEQEHHLTLAEA